MDSRRSFFLKVRPDLVYDLPSFYTSDNHIGSDAISAGFYISTEYSFQPLRPGHDVATLTWRIILTAHFFPGWRDWNSGVTVGPEHAMEPS
jgi:hypothetical protein